MNTDLAAAALVSLSKSMAAGKTYRQALYALPKREREALAEHLARGYGDKIEEGMRALRDVFPDAADEDDEGEEES